MKLIHYVYAKGLLLMYLHEINDDNKLLKEFKDDLEYNPFLKDITKKEILKLDENYNLNYQSKELSSIWAMMLGDAIVFLKKWITEKNIRMK